MRTEELLTGFWFPPKDGRQVSRNGHVPVLRARVQWLGMRRKFIANTKADRDCGQIPHHLGSKAWVFGSSDLVVVLRSQPNELE